MTSTMPQNYWYYSDRAPRASKPSRTTTSVQALSAFSGHTSHAQTRKGAVPGGVTSSRAGHHCGGVHWHCAQARTEARRALARNLKRTRRAAPLEPQAQPARRIRPRALHWHALKPGQRPIGTVARARVQVQVATA
eukprot:3681968-Rhodomonas_salina.1